MPQKQSTRARDDKEKRDIERLLQWAFVDELPKHFISSADGIWDRLTQWGSLGGVNPDVSQFAGGGAQRYAQFGLPHKDAEAIGRAVMALGRIVIDWDADFDLIAHELAALVDVNGLRARRAKSRGLKALPRRKELDLGPSGGDSGFGSGHFGRVLIERVPVSDSVYRGGHFIKGRRTSHGPRDMIFVASIDAVALVHMHAIKKTRPPLDHEMPRPFMPDEGRRLVGECHGKNLYTTGSFCPLHWRPSPAGILLERADYLVWHRALTQLSSTLMLEKYQATPPDAPPAPWIDGEVFPSSFKQVSGRKGFFLPFPHEAERPRAAAPTKKPKHSKARRPRVDRGAKA